MQGILPIFHSDDNRLAEVLGDLVHKQDIIIRFARWESDFTNRYTSNESQANWLKLHRPDLVPDNDPAGKPPSNHQLGNIFELNYFRFPSFRSFYLNSIPSS